MNAARGLFWIKGCPGTGKSVLMKFAVDTMSRRKSGEIIASFFIHGRGIELQQTPIGIFRALLNSLLMSFPKYLAELTKVFQDKQKRYGSYEQKNGWRWNEKEMEKFLSKLLIEGTKEMPVVIFIDALDECGESAKSLLLSLKSLGENAEREESMVKICFSSKHFPILGHEMMARVYVEEKNDQDIRLVIEGRLKEVQPVERRRQIEKEIMLKAHGGFQWAILITNMVLEEDLTGARTEDLLNIISTTPPDLDELYDVILRGATKDKHRQMAKLFQWVVYAKRPLSAQELREALTTDKDMPYTTVSELRSHGNWSDSVSQFEMRVRHISRGLVEFQNRDVYEQYEPGGEEWSKEAQFIHQSAADFVTHKFLTHIEEGPPSKSPGGVGHYEISRSFLKYLAIEEILNASDLSREKLSATFPLMPYGVTFLLSHVRGVEEGAICQADLVTLIQWNQKERLGMLARIWRIMDPEGTHAPRGWPFQEAAILHLVIAFDSPSLLDTLLQRHSSQLDARDLEGNNPLQLALREDHQSLALMIPERSRTWQVENDAAASEDWPGRTLAPRKYLSHVNATNVDGETPLSLAVSIKADEVIRGLIDVGAEVKYEKSLMFYAISQEDKELVYQLMKEGSDLDGAVFFATQCLNRTNGGHHILNDFLKALLERDGDTKRYRGVEINNVIEFDENEEDEEAIFVAIRGGLSSVVSLLLSHGSSANTRGQFNVSPIMLAVEGFHGDIAMALFRDSPNTIFTEDEEGLTALKHVIRTNQITLALSFVEEGQGFLTLHQLLYEAVRMEQHQFVDGLLCEDANVIELACRRLHYDEAPFMIAVQENDEDMVALLLSTGQIDISIRNKDGYTPFSVACQRRHLSIVNLLLETGKIGLNQDDVEEVALLVKFIRNGYSEYYSFYSDDLVSDDGRCEEMEKFLRWAMESEIMEMLLDKSIVGVAEEQTPLRWALDQRDDRMVLLILDAKGFSIHAESNGTSQKLFWGAIERGNIDVIDMLHESGKYDIDTENPWGRTPLMLAADANAEEAMRILLETGKPDI